MSLLSKYLKKTDFASYEDYYANFKIDVPDSFNFAYDVVDYYAAHEPNRKHLYGAMTTKAESSLFAT